ncbi:MAG TPA: UDP-N-acetylglucosamine 2-epimerase (non-hydrolyzing) [Fimbriimonadaceae bacterium]|nr:UDP-N-acetylglucosamine 2-epimerase (non-hydrolyzing) [Fimbriimonadaceae bacterium]
MARRKIACVVGTRPDAIKTAPVVLELRRHPDVETLLLATGQHREMLAQALGAFGLTPDRDLDIMQHGQSLAQVTERSLSGLDELFAEIQPDLVLAQGDTTTTFVAGLAAFYRKVPFGHIEAGLRTDTIWNPFPEEFNRRAVGLFAALHFAPTPWAAENLRREGVADETLFVTGNTGIDAVLDVARRGTEVWFPDESRRILLLTTHRRENWGEPQKAIAEAARDVLETVPDTILVVPMHRNPQVREVLEQVLGDHPRVSLIEPPDYPSFATLLARSDLILTDSGGIQEEAPAFGKPVLVLRTTTERPEGIETGNARLVGTDRDVIRNQAVWLLTDPKAYAAMAQARNPYGDGRAAPRIRYEALRLLGVASPEEVAWA